MADPYAFPEEPTARRRGPRVTLLTVVAVLFVGFMLVNIGITIQNSQERLESLSLEPGDEIEYHYTARLADGTLWETTQFTVAQRANATEGFPLEDESQYVPQRATLDPQSPGLGWGPEVEQAVIDAHVGQTLRVSPGPEHGSGDWERFPPGTEGLPRELPAQSFQRYRFLQEPAAAAEEGNQGTQGFDLDELEQAIGPVEEGTVFNAEEAFPPSWDIVFEDVNRDNRSVLIRNDVEDGQEFNVEGIPASVAVLINDEETQYRYRLDFVEGTTFTIPGDSPLVQSGFQPGSYQVRSVTDENIDLFHHPGSDPDAVGENVEVEIRILNRL